MQFDRQKLREAVHFVVSKCHADQLGAVKLNKVLYYADMVAYALTGLPVTGASYKKRPFGPASDEILFCLRDLSRDKKIDIKSADYFGYQKKVYESLEDYNQERLSDADLALITEMIEFVCEQNTAKTISELSHNAAWDMVEFGEVIPYLASYSLFLNQPDIESLEWADNEGRLIADTGSKKESVGVSDYRSFRSRILEALGQ